MGTSAYEKFMQKSDKPQGGSEYERFMGRDNLDAAAANTDPLQASRAARIKFLQSRTGLDPELIGRNVDEVTKRVAASDFDPDKFRVSFPKTAEWLEKQPENAQIAWDDLPHLSGVEGIVERIISGAVTGYRQSKQGEIGEQVRQAHGHMTDEQNTELTALDADLRATPQGRKFLDYSLLNFGQVLGQMVAGAPASAEYGSAGAAAGATATGILSVIFGPEMLALWPLLTGGGGSVGATYGQAEYARRLEGGSAYLEMRDMRDENGNPYPEEDINDAASVVGMVNATLEMGGLAAEVLPFKNAIQGFMRKTVQDALTRPTAAKALINFGKSYALALGGETGQEVAQELTNVLAEEWLKHGKAGFPESPEDREAALNRLADIAKQTASGMMYMALPGAAAHGSSTLVEARRASRREAQFLALGNQIKDSKTFSLSPTSMQEVVEQHTNDTPLRNVYMPVEKWDEYWQGQKVDPAVIAEHVIGDKTQYEEAKRTGGDVVIPTARYAVTIAPTEHNAYFAKQLRTGPLQMSTEEAQTLLKDEDKRVVAEETQEEIKRREDESKVTDTATQMLVKSGFDEESAKLQAKTLVGRFYRVLSERTGISVPELWDRYKMAIQQSDEEAHSPTETVLTQDDIVKQFIMWKGVMDDPEVSQELRDLAWLRVRDLEPHARAAVKEQFDEANRQYKARTGKEWTYSQSAPRAPAHVAAALDEYVTELGNKIKGEAAPDINDLRRFKYAQHLAQLTRHGTFDDVNVYMATLNDANAHTNDGKMTGAHVLAQVPEFGNWVEDMLRPKPKLDLLQSKGGRRAGPRGRIRIGQNSINIDLLRNADLSTFIHETGHFYLQTLQDFKDHNTEMRSDYDRVKEWLGKKDDGPFTKEEHEQWARGFEKYMAEGTAPIPALRRVFARFKAWMAAVYRSLKELNVDLNDEVRGVFDRMLATKQELDLAQAERRPLFADTKFLTPAESASYTDAIDRAESKAEEILTSRIVKDYNRERMRIYQAERNEVLKVVQEEADNDKALRARSVLTRGTMPSGADLPADFPAFKLSRDAILREHGEETLRTLTGMWTRDENKGLHPDMAADVFGFRSGKQLVRELLNSKDPKEWIKEQTDKRMKSLRPEISGLLKEKEIPVEAQKAVHNEYRSQLLHKELELLAKHDLPAVKGMLRSLVRRIPTLKDLQEKAEKIVGAKTLRSVEPTIYQRAEQTAHRNAIEAFLKGDIPAAFGFKEKELLNHELYRAASKAQDQAERTLRLMRSFDKKSTRDRIGRAGGSYLEQIDAIRERFAFKREGTAAQERRESLREWLDQQAKIGLTPDMSPEAMNEAYRQNYQDLTNDQLNGIYESVKQIRHLALLKNRLLSELRKRTIAETSANMINSMATNHELKGEPYDRNANLWKRLDKKAKGWVAAHTKLEFLFEWLDGFVEHGPVWTAIFKPFVEAENNENKMLREASKNLREIFNRYTKKERALWFWKKEHTFHSGTFTKSQLLTVALNWGNEYNRDALMRGEGWSEEQAQSLIDRLDDRDWDTVQAIWDYIDTFRPLVGKLERELNGREPKWVEATPFTTKSGRTMKGGYYPIVVDRDRSIIQAQMDERQTVEDLYGGGYARAMTQHGHTKARTDTGGKPLRLDLSGLTEHVTNVIHDLTHRRAVIDVARLTDAKLNPAVATAIQQAAGMDMYRQIRPWLQHIAARKHDFVNLPEKLFGHLRVGGTVVNLGLKFSTSVVQGLGALPAMKEIGVKYFNTGVQEIYGKPWKFTQNWNFVKERSEFMRDRLSNYDRDVHDTFRRLNVAGTHTGPMSVMNVWTVPVRDSFFQVIGLADMAVSLPSWMGAYQKAMDGKVDGIAKGDEMAAIHYGDKVVRQTQGVGNAKDLAAVQRGPESWRLWTMFYTYMSGLANQFFKTRKQYQMDKNVPRMVASLTLLWFIPAVLQGMILGQAPDADAEPEEWLKWIGKNEAAYPLQTIVLLRDIVDSMIYEHGEPSVVIDAIKALGKAGSAAVQIATEEDREATKAEVKAMVDAVGYATHLPTKQFWLTTEYFYRFLEGDIEEDNPISAMWHSLVTGAPKDE